MKLVTDYGKPWFTLRNLNQYTNTTSSEPVTLGPENIFGCPDVRPSRGRAKILNQI